MLRSNCPECSKRHAHRRSILFVFSRADKTLQDIVYKLVPGLFKGKVIFLEQQTIIKLLFSGLFWHSLGLWCISVSQMKWNGGGTSTPRIVSWNRGKWWRRSTSQRMKSLVCPYSSTRGTSESLTFSFLFFSQKQQRELLMPYRFQFKVAPDTIWCCTTWAVEC